MLPIFEFTTSELIRNINFILHWLLDSPDKFSQMHWMVKMDGCGTFTVSVDSIFADELKIHFTLTIAHNFDRFFLLFWILKFASKISIGNSNTKWTEFWMTRLAVWQCKRFTKPYCVYAYKINQFRQLRFVDSLCEIICVNGMSNWFFLLTALCGSRVLIWF